MGLYGQTNRCKIERHLWLCIYFIGISTLRANWVVVSCVYLHVFDSLEAKLKRQVQNKKGQNGQSTRCEHGSKCVGFFLSRNCVSYKIQRISDCFQAQGEKNHQFVTKKYNCFLRNILQGSLKHYSTSELRKYQFRHPFLFRDVCKYHRLAARPFHSAYR